MAQKSSPNLSFKDSSISSKRPAPGVPGELSVVPDAKAARDVKGHFTSAFKIAAVRYAATCGKSMRAAALDMGISDKSLGGWINDVNPDADGKIDVERFDELAQLRTANRELLTRNARLTQERDFLKKAAAYFATPSKGATK